MRVCWLGHWATRDAQHVGWYQSFGERAVPQVNCYDVCVKDSRNTQHTDSGAWLWMQFVKRWTLNLVRPVELFGGRGDPGPASHNLGFGTRLEERIRLRANPFNGGQLPQGKGLVAINSQRLALKRTIAEDFLSTGAL